MRIISTSDAHSAILNIRPTHIAVAYVGIDWSSLIAPEELDEIVLSPTLGTNPYAVEQIVEQLGWGSVHFLERLHSKIYIGECSAAIGSFNLSRNGISATGLEETGIYLSDESLVVEARSEYDRIKLLAISEYSSLESKKIRLQKLKKEHGLAQSKGLLKSSAHERSIENYSPLTGRDFYICWWERGEATFNNETVGREAPEVIAWNYHHDYIDFTNLLESDRVEEGDWLLMWRANSNGFPHKSEPMTWLYVDKLVRNGVKDTEYTQLVLQINGLPHMKPPFNIDAPAIQTTLKKAISMRQFSMLRPQAGVSWSIQASADNLEAFLSETRKLFADDA